MRSAGIVVFSSLVAAFPVALARGDEVDFTRDVRPILSKHCFKCHGPDDAARKGELRLDVAEAAFKGGASGEPAIVVDKPEESEFFRRIVSDDASEVMPPPSAKLALSDAQKDILKRWINQGANYVPHWAFIPPRQAPLPAVQLADWPRNEIDRFVLAKMEAAGLAPSPEADKATLVRRLFLDLVGLPPSPEEADEFLKDTSAGAYEKLVDRLLRSPHYGERWARKWLDLARYADTNGYEKDRPRSMWPYRDWVIQSLNDDMPFDRFTIEQVAGDMLPDAGVSQRIATAFHRNTMLNEEGGIDPLEFRFYAMTDRVATTGTVWLGLTLGCCQCHTHKYDPITQREYYQVMAFLNNADEPTMNIPQAEIETRRRETEQLIATRIAELPAKFPPAAEYEWHSISPASVASAGGATFETLDDRSIRVGGASPEKDTYTIVFDTDLPHIDAIQVEALSDPQLPSQGPGRTPHGNFVLSELSARATGPATGDEGQAVKFVSASADFSQDGFPAASAIDGQPSTGWAIHGPGKWNVNRTATFLIDPAHPVTGPAHWSITLDQQHGTQHTLGKFRIRFAVRNDDPRSEDVRRRDNLERRLAAWSERESQRVVRWTRLRPIEARSNLPILNIQSDDSIFVSGDQTKRDVYDLKYKSDLEGITAIRIEALPDERLPSGGPGRTYYEGPFGDFRLTNLALSIDGKPAKFSRGTQSFASGNNTAAGAIDDDPFSGWSISGRQGEISTAVFNLAEPLPRAAELSLQMIFEMYYATGLGRFRVYATTDPRPAEATGLPDEIEAILLTPAAQRTEGQHAQLLQQFVQVAPELVAEQAEIRKLRTETAAYPTILVMTERSAAEPRPTFVHKRGEFLQPTEQVLPGVPGVLPPVTGAPSRDRLAFARWLVSGENPLTGRVTINRQWAAFFGKGLVRTIEDFGFQGEAPTHPELLDWLAVELIHRGWSIKQMQRLIVTSATYRQSSAVTPQLLEADPTNRWLARAPRFRVEAELVRDSALKISGLLTEKIGGPSVFPPLPDGVATEGAYAAMSWSVSTGPDRFRRGLYTFSKRTAPYAMFNTFDSPSGEACVARREVSNTPLQALTMMNDTVFWEAAQALGALVAGRGGSTAERIDYLFRRCLVRPPTEDERQLLTQFVETQRGRLVENKLDVSKIAGPGESDPLERALWTVTARALLNLDETITRN